MVCDTRLVEGQNPAQRFAEVLAVTAKLRGLLAAGQVTVKIGAQGALALQGWSEQDRKGVSDACAYRTLSQSWEMRQAIAKAEMLGGRKLNAQAMANGIHSHDGGKTWHPGH